MMSKLTVHGRQQAVNKILMEQYGMTPEEYKLFAKEYGMQPHDTFKLEQATQATRSPKIKIINTTNIEQLTEQLDVNKERIVDIIQNARRIQRLPENLQRNSKGQFTKILTLSVIQRCVQAVKRFLASVFGFGK